MELKSIPIKSIKKLDVKRKVYDLSVQGNHNFFIGKTNILTHNCDFLSRDAQPALRNIMEAYSATTRFILTANYIERIIDPLVSRTQVYKLTPPTKKDAAIRLSEILKNENVEYEKQTIAQIVHAYYPDLRKIINTAQLQTRNGKLQVSVEQLIGQDLKLKVIDALMSSVPLKEKVNQIRQFVADQQIQDFTELFHVLYMHVEDYAPTKVPETVIALAEGQYRSSMVPDQELNFIATLYTILTQ